MQTEIPKIASLFQRPGYVILVLMDAPAHFIPERDPPTFYPLRAYLRMLPTNVTAEYIAALTAAGDLVIDPFANTPAVARIAQKMGRRAISVEANPLWSWLARAMATPPTEAEVNALLARLGDALKDGVPLRVHIRQMYDTICAACREPTPAAYFIHARDGGPVKRHYVCAHCGETRDDTATEDDLKRYAAFEAHGLHYHIAFERTVPAENLFADRIRRILDLYTPRNLTALVTLTTKIDTLFRAAEERKVLNLLLLHLLDRGTSFYATPEATAHIAAHKQFVEFNLWDEIETAARALATTISESMDGLVNSVAEIAQTTEPRVFVSRGSARSLVKSIPEHSVALFLTAPPQRRLAVWALSYFWGAWALGRAAVDSLISSLDPHKNDPNWERRWYFDSLVGSLDAIAKLLRPNGRAVFVFTERWQEVIETLLLAGAGARLEFESLIFQPGLGDFPRREFDSIRGDYRVSFLQRGSVPLKILAEPQLAKKMHAAALDAGREILARRGEPLPYAWVHLAAYTRLAREGYLGQVMSANTKIPPGRFVSYAVREGLSEGYAHDLDHFATPDQFVWLRHPTAEDEAAALPDPPLVERVDDAVCALLQERGSIPEDELENILYRQFPCDLTPEAGLIALCAETYADKREGVWYRRVEDEEQTRENAFDLLTRLGERLEYQVVRAGANEKPTGPLQAIFDLSWIANGEIAHGFAWRNRPRLGDFAGMQVAPTHGYVVIPERRVPLLATQTRRLPLLVSAFNEAGWDFVRAPFVEKLLESEKIERHDLVLITGLLPHLAGERTQLELF